jgi:DNA-binding MarR family transcriptional regulator
MPVQPAPAASPSVLEERRNNPGLLLALLGQDAMRELRSALTENGLVPQQFHVLALLHDHGPLAQSELGPTVGTDPSVLVTLLNPLESEGLITRRRDPDDRRRHIVALTKSGRAKLRSATRAQERAEDILFMALDEDQRQELGTLLVAIRDSLRPGFLCQGSEAEDRGSEDER